MRRLPAIVLLLVLVVSGLSFGQAHTASFPPQGKGGAAGPMPDELCTRLWTGYVAMMKEFDPVKGAGFFTNDAVLIYPDMAELTGRDAIQAHFLKFSRVKINEATFTLNQCAVAGDRAFTFVTIDESYQQGERPPVKTLARVGAVWRKQSDGEWKISYFLLNHLTR